MCIVMHVVVNIMLLVLLRACHPSYIVCRNVLFVLCKKLYCC